MFLVLLVTTKNKFSYHYYCYFYHTTTTTVTTNTTCTTVVIISSSSSIQSIKYIIISVQIFFLFFCEDSRDWQHSGPKDRTLLCWDCRAYYKKYGELPPITNTNNSNNNNNRTDAPYLFRPVQTESPEGSPGRMRTRNKAKETVRK